MRQMLVCAVFAAVMLFAAGQGLGGDTQHVVGQKGKQFSTTAVTLRRGETIRFVNDDTVTHNVFSKSPSAPFDLKLQRPGQSEEVRFEQPGTAVVRCAIHPMMRLEVTVEP